MQKIPPLIADFLKQEHILSLACQGLGEIWAANCFYQFDGENNRLLILTSRQTQHGKIMLAQPKIAGTIAHQTEQIHAIEGVQFTAIARCLTDPTEQKIAYTAYFARFPFAQNHKSDIWALELMQLKHTHNKTQFAQKQYWQNENSAT